MTKTMQ